jgi:hypothetical protein
MCVRSVRMFLALVCCLISACASSAFAQAVIQVSTSATTATDIGQTELAGPIIFTVFSGTTKADQFMVIYSLPITNNAASDISILGSGHFPASISATVSTGINGIVFNLPAGATSGDSIIISGVRLGLAGSQATQATATIVSSANTIWSSQVYPTVISNVQQPISVDETVAAPVSYRAGVITNSSSSFLISEVYGDAFKGLGQGGGQTVATQLRITPLDTIASGAVVAFPPLVTSPTTGATLSTLSGLSETVPRDDGSSDVVYVFSPGVDSANVPESFAISVTLTQAPSAGSGSIRFQVAMFPIGAAVPDAAYPSTAIPRYAERLVPGGAGQGTGTTTLHFPFQISSDNTYTGIAITNPFGFQVRGTFTAYNTSGTIITGSRVTNPVTITLPANGQYARVATEIFGDGFNLVSGGMIEFVGQTSELKGFYMIGSISGLQLDGGNAEMNTATSWYIPIVFHQGSSPFNLLQIYNPGTSQAAVNLKLLDAGGTQIATDSETVLAGVFLSRDIASLFRVNLTAFQGGYIQMDSDFPVVLQSFFGNALESNILSAQYPSSSPLFFIPHFATGSLNSTELTLVNTNSATAELTITLLDNSGNTISQATPASLSISSNSQATRTLASLFPNLGSNLVTGSIRIDIQSSFVGPFPMGSRIMGVVRYANADGSASAAVPLLLTASTDFVYSHVAQGPGYYTGLAVQNTNDATAQYTVEVYSKDGDLVGTYTSALSPHARFSKLLKELVPASSGQVGGYIRITSNQPLSTLALFGSLDMRSLSAISPQIMD